MKNIINKLLVLLLVLFVGISLTACDKDGKDTTNKNVPVGTLSSDVFAKVGNITLSEKQLYNEMRVNGYDYLIDELIKVLVNPGQYDLNTDEVSNGVKELILQQCYGTSDEEALAKMNSSTKEKYRAKFVDSMFLIGVEVNNSEDGIFTEDSLKHFVNQYAQKEFVKKVLTDSNSKYYYANEFYKNDEDKEVANPYYVSEEAIESAYNSDKNADATYNVVIVGYETLAQAQLAVGDLDVNALEAKDLVALYKDRYSYKFEENAEPTIDNDYFKLTDAELAKYNSSLVTMIKNIDKENEGKFTAKAYQQFGDTVYFVGVQGKKVEADYAKLEGENKEDAKKETLDEIIENKLTSSTISTILFEKLYESEVVIYDYVYDALYAVQNTNHKRLEASEWNDSFNNTVATINGTPISVETFYNKLYTLLGVSTTMDYFTSELLLESEFVNQITKDDTKANDESFDKVMKSFNNDELASSGLPKVIGEDVFKFLYFGTTNNDEIKEYYKSQSAWTYYAKSKPENYYNLIETFGKNYVGFKQNESDPYNGKFFDLSVKHILLTVDYNGDGNPDDPEIFCSEANVTKTDLETAVKETMQVIANEVHYLVGEKGYASLEDALDFILKEYYKNGKVHHNDSTWDEHKSEFHFGLTIEDLGSVNNSTVSKYVKEFGIGTQKLYNKLKNANLLDEEFLIAEIKSSDDEETTTITVSNDDLIPTSFGYHVLAVYDSGNITSAKYTASLNDSGKHYESITIKLDGKKETLNAYSEEEWASLNQIKIYAAQVNTDDGVTDLPSSVKTFISNIYSNFTARFNDEKFRNILFAETYLDIEYTGSDAEANTDKFEEFIKIQQRQYDSYEDYSETSINVFANWWNLILPQSEPQA